MVKTMQTQKAALFLSDNGLINCPFRLRDALLWSNNQVFGAITAAISQDTPLFDTNFDANMPLIWIYGIVQNVSKRHENDKIYQETLRKSLKRRGCISS